MRVTRDITIGGRTWSITAAASQDELLSGVRTDHDVEYFPYGLLLWASSVGLAEHLVANPDIVGGRRVLEIGCGVGLAGLVASTLGARVTQTDYLPEAMELARWNADQNGIMGIDRLIADWREFPAVDPFDIVLGSDVLYERTMHPVLENLLPKLTGPAGTVLLSDPVRPQAIDFAGRIEGEGWDVGIDTRFVEWDGDRREIGLFALKRQTGP